MTISGSEASTLLLQLGVAAARTIILAAFAGLLMAAFRVKAAHLRLFAWIAVLYAGLGMPLLGRMLPSVGVPLPFAASAAPTKIVNDVSPATPARVRQLTVQEIAPAPAASTSLSTARPVSTRRSSWREMIASIPWNSAALAMYLAIALLLVARLIIGVVLARRLVRHSTQIHDPRLDALIQYPSSLRVPAIRESRSVSVPLTIGVLSPTVVLPSSWRDWDNDKLAGVLTHEMSHVARHDCLSQYVSLLHRAVFWFSPLSWWLNRQIIELAEQASDEEALARGADQHSYARMLLGFLESVQATPGRVRWQGVSMASSGRAEKRLEKVLAWRGDSNMGAKKLAMLLIMAVAIPATYLVAAARPASPGHSSPAAKSFQEQPSPPAATPSEPQAPEASPANPTAPPPPKDGGISNSGPLPPGPSAPTAPAMPAAPQSPASPDSTLAADSAQNQADSESRHRGFWYRYGYDDEQRFVIVSGKSDSFTMSGTGEDARHVEKLKQRIPGDFIWFERDEKSYIIRDQATVDRARQLWAPQEELGKKQAALGKQQEALGKQQEELGKRMQEVRVKVPDMSAELDKLKAELQELGPNATVEQIGRIQSEIGRLQSKIGRIQSDAGDEQGKIGEQMGELGSKQGELGRQQGELGRQQGELAEKANRDMKQLLDDAIKKGIAQPEGAESGGASL